MRPNRSLAKGGLVAAWMALVIGGALLTDWGFGFWRQQQQEWSGAQQRLGRMQGWVAVEEEILTKVRERLGPFAEVRKGDYPWAVLSALQNAARTQGISVTELRPTELSGRDQPSRLSLDAKVEGDLSQMSRFLQNLPESMPGLRLESFQLQPQKEGRVQSVIRFLLPLPASGSENP